jgi:hypothetical protein
LFVSVSIRLCFSYFYPVKLAISFLFPKKTVVIAKRGNNRAKIFCGSPAPHIKDTVNNAPSLRSLPASRWLRHLAKLLALLKRYKLVQEKLNDHYHNDSYYTPLGRKLRLVFLAPDGADFL